MNIRRRRAVDRGQGAGPEREEVAFYHAAGVCGVARRRRGRPQLGRYLMVQSGDNPQ